MTALLRSDTGLLNAYLLDFASIRHFSMSAFSRVIDCSKSTLLSSSVKQKDTDWNVSIKFHTYHIPSMAYSIMAYSIFTRSYTDYLIDW